MIRPLKVRMLQLSMLRVPLTFVLVLFEAPGPGAPLNLTFVMSGVLQEQRGRTNPTKQLWEDSRRVSSDLPDINTLIQQATTDRLQVCLKFTAGGGGG